VSAATVAERRLETWNEFTLPLLRAARGLRLSVRAAENLKRRPVERLVSIDFDPKSTIAVLSLRLSKLVPGLRDINYVLYISAQTSKKKVPKQVRTIIRRLRRKKMLGDTVLALIAPRGATRGAYALLKREGIVVFRDAREALEYAKRYLVKRADRLREALRGKRIWGEVAVIALLLFEILRELRLAKASDTALIELYEAAVAGKPKNFSDILSLGVELKV